ARVAQFRSGEGQHLVPSQLGVDALAVLRISLQPGRLDVDEMPSEGVCDAGVLLRQSDDGLDRLRQGEALSAMLGRHPKPSEADLGQTPDRVPVARAAVLPLTATRADLLRQHPEALPEAPTLMFGHSSSSILLWRTDICTAPAQLPRRGHSLNQVSY